MPLASTASALLVIPENLTEPVAVSAAMETEPEKRPFPWTPSDICGEVVPIPRKPADVIVVVPVCPAEKRLKRPLPAKKLVEVAFASVVLPVTVSELVAVIELTVNALYIVEPPAAKLPTPLMENKVPGVLVAPMETSPWLVILKNVEVA